MKKSRRRSPADAAAILASLGLDNAADAQAAGPDEEKTYATVYFDGDSVLVGADYIDLVRQCAERFIARPAGLLIVWVTRCRWTSRKPKSNSVTTAPAPSRPCSKSWVSRAIRSSA